MSYGNWGGGYGQWHPQAPPPKGTSGWTIFAIIGGAGALCLGLILLNSLLGVHSRTSGPRLVISANDTHEIRFADPPKVGAGCANRKEGELKVACQRMVRERLKAPSTAEFPGWLEDPKVTIDDRCVETYTAWVDARNAFNAPIRTTFSCALSPSTGLVTLESIQ